MGQNLETKASWKTPGFLAPLFFILCPVCIYLGVSCVSHDTHPYIAVSVGIFGGDCIFLAIYFFHSWLHGS